MVNYFGGQCDNAETEHPGFPCNHWIVTDEEQRERDESEERSTIADKAVWDSLDN